MIKKSLLLSALVVPSVLWAAINPYTADYDFKAAKGAGSIAKTLTLDGDNYTATSNLHAHKLMFSKDINQTSVGSVDNGVVQAITYTVSGDEQQSTSIPAGDYDNLSIVLQLREDLDAGKNGKLTYKVLRKNGDEDVTYTVSADHEKLDTAMGELDTVKVENIKDNGDSTSYWFAPSLNYAMVKAVIMENKVLKMQAMIKSYKAS